MRKWTTIRTETLLEREPWLRVVADDVQLPDGQVVRGYLRLEARDFVVVVPVDRDGRVGLLRSYKHGLGEISIQPPAGYIEEHEAPETAARRELLEETGCRPGELHPLGRYASSGNRGNGLASIFLATECVQVEAPRSGDLEEQELMWVPVEEAQRLWRTGGFDQLPVVAAVGLALDRLAGHS